MLAIQKTKVEVMVQRVEPTKDKNSRDKRGGNSGAGTTEDKYIKGRGKPEAHNEMLLPLCTEPKASTAGDNSATDPNAGDPI